MNKQQVNKIKNAFDTILRADYLALDKIDDLNNLNAYYIDYFNSLSSILQKQDNFISGRRGTGKTSVLLRGYIECIKSLNNNSSYLNSKILPIYIDLSNCDDIFDKDNFGLFEAHFIRQIIDSLRRQLESIYDKKTLSIFRKENPALDDLEYIEKILVEGKILIQSKVENVSTKESLNLVQEDSAKVSTTALSVNMKDSATQTLEKSRNYTSTKGVNTQEFLNKISDILSKAKIDATYLFLDEYSDLNLVYQQKFSRLLKTLLGSKANLFIKVGVITDRFDFGDKIIIGRDIFPIPLDLNEHVERMGGLSSTIKKLEESIPELVQKRLDIYADGIKFEEIIKGNKEDILSRIARASLGVTRSVGLILQNAWKQAEQYDCKIGLTEINYGIRATRKTYQKQYEGAVKKKLIPGYYNDMWMELTKRAIYEKAKKTSRPASHFMIDPNRNEYLNVFKENFLVHLLEEGRSSKYGGNYNLYALDYDICVDLNIKYAENKDEYTAARFIYDSVFSNYDAYFSDEKLKSYKCPHCNKIYKEEEVVKSKVKRCFDDDEILTEVIHQEFEVSQGNFAEVEVKILGLIASLRKDEAMSALDISNAVGCTKQKVASWCSRVLAPKNDIFIQKVNRKNYYYGEE